MMIHRSVFADPPPTPPGNVVSMLFSHAADYGSKVALVGMLGVGYLSSQTANLIAVVADSCLSLLTTACRY